MTQSVSDKFEEITKSVDAAISIMSRTIGLYEKVSRREELSKDDVLGILGDLKTNKTNLLWAYKELGKVAQNPFHFKFIKIHSEEHSTAMAINLLSAMALTSPGKPFPPAGTMVEKLGITTPENISKFSKGYEDAVSKIESSHASAQTKSFNIWYWICMSMFGTFAFLVVLWIIRKFYEMVMELRESIANLIKPGEFSRFKLFTLVKRKSSRFNFFPFFTMASSDS